MGRRLLNAFYPLIGPVILVAMLVCFMLAAVDLKPNKRRLETLSAF